MSILPPVVAYTLVYLIPAILYSIGQQDIEQDDVSVAVSAVARHYCRWGAHLATGRWVDTLGSPHMLLGNSYPTISKLNILIENVWFKISWLWSKVKDKEYGR